MANIDHQGAEISPAPVTSRQTEAKCSVTSTRRTCPENESILNFTDSDPFDFYAKTASQGSPVWDESAKAWLILDYEQCAACERDESAFANAYVFADPIVRQIKGGGANLTLSRDEEHDRLRKFHLMLLSPASVKQYLDVHIEPVIDNAFERIEKLGRCELTAELCAQIPPRVICRLLGMPDDDPVAMARILTLNEQIVHFIASGYRDAELRDGALAASAELNSMLIPYIRERRERPTDDFISRVWQEAPVDGIDLDEEGALGLCREIYFAGSDTTVHGLANALYLMLSDKELFERVRADRGKPLSALVEESLRLMNVVQFRHRFCIRDTQVGDTLIRNEEMIILVHARRKS